MKANMPPEPHWTQYLAALLTPTVAVLGLWLASRQWRTAQNKLKLDLFDRRFTVFAAANAFLLSIFRSGKAIDDEAHKYLVATREAKWLFDDSIAEYLEKQIYRKALDLQVLDSELQGIPAGEERSINIRAQVDLKKWFIAQHETMDERFSPFLRLSH